MATQQESHVGVSVDGLTVSKSVSKISRNVFQVTLEFRSYSDNKLTFVSIEELPDEIDRRAVGFHPEHGGDLWAARPEELRYTDTIEPGNTVRTVYAVRGIPESVAHQLRCRPRLSVIEVQGEDGGMTAMTAENLDGKRRGDPTRDR